MVDTFIRELPPAGTDDKRFIAEVCNGSARASNSLLALNGRERLQEPRSYYVATTGSDANDGLTSANAFATIQKALDVVWKTLDLSQNVVVINVADGTYTENLVAAGVLVGSGPLLSAANVLILGNTTTWSNVHISGGAGAALSVYYGAALTIAGVKLTGLFGISCNSGTCYYFYIDFGTTTVAQVYSTRPGAWTEMLTNCEISGGASEHIQSSHHGNARIGAGVLKFTANCAFSATTAFAYALTLADITVTGGATINLNGFTVTGKRHLSDANSVIQWASAPGAPQPFPGNVNGTTANGGVTLF
jgi:hypothetical protein